MKLSEAKQEISRGKEAWLVVPGTSENRGYAVSREGDGFICEESISHHESGAGPGGQDRYETWEKLLTGVKHAQSDRWEVLR